MMKKSIAALAVAGSMLLAAPVLADGSKWKNGMMFTQQEIATLQGHKAVKIVFGLEPGKCTGQLTAPSEWLKMTEGRLVQSYPGKGDFERVAGDEWYQADGTKVTVCNRSAKRAVLIGVQFRK